MRKLKPQNPDFDQIAKFIVSARKKLESAKKALAIDEEISYQLAYEAMLKASLGLMLSYGVRPRSLPGHHITIIAYAEAKLGKEFKHLIAMFDRMRRKRNQSIYEVGGFISTTDARHALASAEQYLKTISEAIQKKEPQIKLL
jgi:uncharacterized protein (UPF0332 family)